MQIFLKNLQGNTKVMTLSENSDLNNLKNLIESVEGIPVDQQRLYSRGRLVNDVNFENGQTIELSLPMLGGGATGNTNMEPAFVALVQKYIYNKKICRLCYASNPVKATNCRKRKCGKCGSLRMKKMLKVK